MIMVVVVVVSCRVHKMDRMGSWCSDAMSTDHANSLVFTFRQNFAAEGTRSRIRDTYLYFEIRLTSLQDCEDCLKSTTCNNVMFMDLSTGIKLFVLIYAPHHNFALMGGHPITIMVGYTLKA